MEVPPAGVCGLRAGDGRGEGPAPLGTAVRGLRHPAPSYLKHSLKSLPYVMSEDLEMCYFIPNVTWKSWCPDGIYYFCLSKVKQLWRCAHV